MKLHFTWSPQALATIRQADRETALRILHALTRLAQSGEGDVKRLKGPFHGQRRLRIGAWRVRFEVLDDNTHNILAIEHRGQAYR